MSTDPTASPPADLLSGLESPDFNPMAMVAGMMTGATRFHSVYLTPMPPTLAGQVRQFLADGTGPLATLVDQVRTQGSPDPVAATRQILGAAQGLVVVVLQLEHGIATIPQFFFGHLDEAARRQLVAGCGPTIPQGEAVAVAFEHLERKLAGGVRWPALLAGPEAGGDVHEYWLDLGAQAVAVVDQGLGNFFGGVQRLRDLAWAVSLALPASLPDGQITPEDLDLLVHCQLLAGEVAAAGQGIDALIQTGEMDEDGFIELITGFADGAIAAEAATSGTVGQAAAWLAERATAWAEATGVDYDLYRALFRLQAAAGIGGEALVITAGLLWGADRKTARQDLTREPLWQVVAQVPADGLIDTAAAATLVDRSTTFIAKRLDQRTIPWCQTGEQIRIPKAPLEAWAAIMAKWQLLG